MELKKIILHRIDRKDNLPPKVYYSNHLLPAENLLVENFVIKIIKSFRKKYPTYGRFQEDILNYPFQTIVKKLQSDGDFFEFSKSGMTLLEKAINVPGALGGYVVFIWYLRGKQEYIMTIMLDKSVQFGINDESFDLEELSALNIDKIARANRLNLTKWDNEDPLYLAFIKGTRSVSKYFQEFIGNTDLTSSRDNINKIHEVLNKYMRESSFTTKRKTKVNYDVKSYFLRQFDKKQDVKLDVISSLIDPDEPDNFINYIDDDLGISGSFRISKKADIKSFHRSKVSEDGFTLEFDNNLVSQKKIVKKGQNIVIKNVSEENLKKIFNS